MGSNQTVFIYSTFPTKSNAEKVAEHLVEKNLIACANIFQISSIYRWKGKIERQKEFALIGKTLKKNVGKIEKEIKILHSYEVPAITSFVVKVNKDFGEWIEKEVE